MKYFDFSLSSDHKVSPSEIESFKAQGWVKLTEVASKHGLLSTHHSRGRKNS